MTRDPRRPVERTGFALSIAIASAPRAMETGDILATDTWHVLFFVERVSGPFHHVGPASAPVSQGLIAVASEASGKVRAALPYAGVVYTIDAASGEYTSFASAGFLQYPRALPIPPGGDVIVADNAGVIRLAAELDGNLVFTQPAEHAVKRLVFPWGAVQLLATLDARAELTGLAVEDDGTIVLADDDVTPGGHCSVPYASDGYGQFFRIDPVSGATTPLLSQNGEWRLGGIAIYRGPSVITPVRTPTWGSLKARYR